MHAQTAPHSGNADQASDEFGLLFGKFGKLITNDKQFWQGLGRLPLALQLLVFVDFVDGHAGLVGSFGEKPHAALVFGLQGAQTAPHFTLFQIGQGAHQVGQFF